MRRFYRFLIIVCASVCSLACAKQDEPGLSGRQGSFSLSLQADESVVPVKAQTVALPQVQDFAVWIEDAKGTEVRRWATYAEFPDVVRLEVGDYVLKASYGEVSASGFELPAFQGQTAFSIRSGEQQQVSLTCKYAKTLVSVEPQEGFKNFYKDFSTEVTTTGTTPVVFTKAETRTAYLEPGALAAVVRVTRQNGSEADATMPSVGTTLAAEHYTLKLDVNEGAGGIAFTLIETATNDVILDEIVPLEAASAGPPYFVPTGFLVEQPVVTSPESFDKDVRILIKARGYIKRCSVSVTSSYLISKNVPALFDLASTSLNVDTKNILKEVGIRYSENMQGSTMAEINLSDLVKQLPAAQSKPGEHTLRFTLEDSYGRVAEVLPLKFLITQPVPEIRNILRVAENKILPNYSVEIDLTASVENGRFDDLTDIQFQQGVAWKSLSEVGAGYTETSGTKPEERIYKITGLPAGPSQYSLRLVHTTPSPFNTQRLSEPVTGYVDAPVFYTNLINYTDTQAVLEVSSAKPFDSSKLSVRVRNQGAWEPDGTVTGYEERDNPSDPGNKLYVATVKVTGLTPSEQYRIQGVSEGIYNAVTEAIFQTEGFKFESWNNASLSDVLQGGQYGWKTINAWGTRDSDIKQDKVSVPTDEPIGWATVNKKTAAAGFSPWNSWYVAASTQRLTDGNNGSAARLRSVVWDNRGPEVPNNIPADPSWKPAQTVRNETFKTEVTPPDLSQCFRAAGKLFLGTYNCLHYSSGAAPSETYDETGLKLRSKPVALGFMYRFVPCGTDVAHVRIVLYDENGIEVARGEADIKNEVSQWTSYSVPIVYARPLKVARMEIMFSSSKDENNIQVAESRETCTATGNVFDIDDVKLVY